MYIVCREQTYIAEARHFAEAIIHGRNAAFDDSAHPNRLIQTAADVITHDLHEFV